MKRNRTVTTNSISRREFTIDTQSIMQFYSVVEPNMRRHEATLGLCEDGETVMPTPQCPALVASLRGNCERALVASVKEFIIVLLMRRATCSILWMVPGRQLMRAPWIDLCCKGWARVSPSCMLIFLALATRWRSTKLGPWVVN